MRVSRHQKVCVCTHTSQVGEGYIPSRIGTPVGTDVVVLSAGYACGRWACMVGRVAGRRVGGKSTPLPHADTDTSVAGRTVPVRLNGRAFVCTCKWT